MRQKIKWKPKQWSIKILFIFMILAFFSNINQVFGQYSSHDEMFGADRYWSSPVKQSENTWCVFACLEMFFGTEQCVFVTNFVEKYTGPSPITCCQKTYSNPTLQKKYKLLCVKGVPLRNLPEFLSTTFNSVCHYTVDIPTCFGVNGSRDCNFPCFGLIYGWSHCVYVFGVKRSGSAWYVYYIDPWDGNSYTEILYGKISDLKIDLIWL